MPGAGAQAHTQRTVALVVRRVLTVALRPVLVGAAAKLGVDGKIDIAISLVALACTVAAQNLVIWSRLARLESAGLELA